MAQRPHARVRHDPGEGTASLRRRARCFWNLQRRLFPGSGEPGPSRGCAGKPKAWVPWTREPDHQAAVRRRSFRSNSGFERNRPPNTENCFRARWVPHCFVCAIAERGNAARSHHRSPFRCPSVFRQADHAVREFCGAGGDRDGERTAPDRDARGPGSADRDRRDTVGHQQLAGRADPRLDAMLDRALRLCEAAFGTLFTFEGEFFRQAATRNRKVPIDRPFRPGPKSAGGRLLRGERFVHITDARDDEAYRSDDPARVRLVDGEGACSCWRCRCAKERCC